MDSMAHVRTHNPEVIGDMLAILETDMMFGVKYDIMITFGKIGPRAGLETANIIRKTIYDSQSWVVAARDRVLERLTASEEEWELCNNCCYGRVHNEESHGARACPICLGLGYQPRH